MRASATNNAVRSSVAKTEDTAFLRQKDETGVGSQTSHRENEGILHSWKEVAVYLCRDVRTVQRWERHEGLPVCRHGHRRGASVYAFKNEIDQWQRNRSVRRSVLKQEVTPVSGLPALRTVADEQKAILFQFNETALLGLLVLFAVSVASTHVAECPASGERQRLMKQSRDSMAINEKANGKSSESYSCLSRLL